MMADSKELKRIKKKYGEKFMRFCREIFPTILEHDGRLEEILSLTFAGNSRTLYEDIVNAGLEADFKNYIYSKIDVEDPDKKIIAGKSPYELLDEAGYVLTECLTEEDIQGFKRYYKPGEELCTFDGGRLNRCVVFFAVKKNAEEIKRENFKNPKREDEYGTSVMGIQFNREGLCTVSIKNRYNHTVNNPDATYGNDLDRIVPGLTESFAILLDKEYGLKLNDSNKEEFEIPNYVVANDGKYYKYNMEINAKYYCPGNIIISDGEVKRLENPESQILMDYFVLDMKNRTIKLYDEYAEDSFIDGLQNLQEAQIIVQKSEKNGRIITIQKPDKEPIIVEIDCDNQIIRYENLKLEQIGNYFLKDNRALSDLKLPELESMGNNFLCENVVLIDLNLPKLEQIGDNFLDSNVELTNLNLPSLKRVGKDFLIENQGLTSLDLPQLKQVGNDFLFFNHRLKNINLSNLEQVGNSFLYYNKKLTNLNLPKLRQAGKSFLSDNLALVNLDLPNLERAGDYFLRHNMTLTNLNLPKLRLVGSNCLNFNEVLTNLKLPNLEKVGDYFLECNEMLTDLNLPQLRHVGKDFLSNNRALINLDLPNLEEIGNNFLKNNQTLIRLNLPKIKPSKNLSILVELGVMTPFLKSKLEQVFNKNEEREKSSDDCFSMKDKYSIVDENAKEIDARNIAVLDSQSELTMTDVSMAQNVIEDVKDVFLRKKNKDEK